MSSSDKIIDKLGMPASAIADMARAVPTDVIKGIVSDHYRRSAPTPPPQKSVVDTLTGEIRPEGRLIGAPAHRRATNDGPGLDRSDARTAARCGS